MNSLIKKNGINFGLILGILLALPTLIGYAFNPNILVSWWTLVYVFFSVIILGLLVIGYTKKGFKGFINFKDAFTSYFIMLVISILISTIISILIFNVVDTDFKEVVKERQIEVVENQREWVIGKMINGDSPQDKIDETEQKFDEGIEKIKNQDQYSVGKQIQGFFIFTAIFSIFGLLLSLILKKKNPEL